MAGRPPPHAMAERPSHHAPDGRYRNPWPQGRDAPPGEGDLLKWAWERWRGERVADPTPEELPRTEPRLGVPRLRNDAAELRVTWIGHATFLIQLPGVTLLTDPVFSKRASPVQWAGPKRLTPPALELDSIPPVDAILLSHDHYDHLDAPTVRALNERFGSSLTWHAPLGYKRWFDRRGVTEVRELDWWEETRLEGAPANVRIRALPAQHWTKRRPFGTRKRLWCSWSVEMDGRRLYFGGDSGYFPGFTEIGDREGPFDVALLPIGAYAPRWFMKSSHMNPEEAAQAARDLHATAMVGMHWGTFRLTDEPPLEPPRRMRQAWTNLGLPPSDLHIPAFGETLSF